MRAACFGNQVCSPLSGPYRGKEEKEEKEGGDEEKAHISLDFPKLYLFAIRQLHLETTEKVIQNLSVNRYHSKIPRKTKLKQRKMRRVPV